MPIVEIQHQGQTFEIDAPEGMDPAQAVAEFEQSQGISTPEPESRGIGDMLSDFGTGGIVKALFPDSPAADVTEFVNRLPERAVRTVVGEDPVRGVGLAARTIGGAVPRTAAGLGDIVGAGLDTALGAVGAEPQFGTGRRASVDQFLSDLGLPEPESFAERLVDTGGEALLTAGAGTAGLASRARGAQQAQAGTQGVRGTAQATDAGVTPGVAPAPARVGQGVDVTSQAPAGLADEIIQFFVENPKLAGALEFGGGAGAQAGGELAADADVGPGGQMLASIGGGVAGSLAPAAGVQTTRRAAGSLAESFAPASAAGSERRAARALQEAAADPEQAAKDALAAPEGVRPAQATGDARLQAMDRRVLDDDPELERVSQDALQGAEDRTVARLADQFGEGQDVGAWQQQVVQTASPEGTTITRGQPDEMVRQAEAGFETAYNDAAGFPVNTKVMQTDGGDVPLPEQVVREVLSADTLTDDATRNGIMKWFMGRYSDMTRRGSPSTRPVDQGNMIHEVDSQDLLDLRQTVRKEARRRAKAGVNNATAAEQAELLQGIDRALTDVLESQLPEEASKALKATDARYREFKTVEDAVNRSGEKGLTPEALRRSASSRVSPGQAARGELGPMGGLAERGKRAVDLLKPAVTKEQVQRTVRTMDDAEKQALKSDMNREILKGAEKDTVGVGNVRQVSGKDYLKRLDQNRDKLEAAGWTADDFKRAETIAKELQMIQRRSPKAVEALITDNVGNIMRMVAASAGSVGASRLLGRIVGSVGAGPSLIVSRFGSQNIQRQLEKLSVDNADKLMRAAMEPTPEGKELFAALMTKPTDAVAKQDTAARTLNAFFTSVASDDEAE